MRAATLTRPVALACVALFVASPACSGNLQQEQILDGAPRAIDELWQERADFAG